MARIPQPRAGDFQLQGTARVRAAAGIDASGLGHLGRTLARRGMDLGAEQARQEGIEAQTAAGDSDLVRRDSGFFGIFDKDFNEGAKFVFQKRKRLQVDGLIGELEAANPRDPRAFRAALQERRNEVFDRLPSDVQAGVKLYFDQEAQAASQRLKDDGIAHETRSHKQEVLLEVERIGRAAALEVENTGVVTPETEGTLQALQERMGEMGFLPAEIEAAEQGVRDDLSVASLVHQYRNLEPGQRNAWARSLLAADGPLRDRSFIERTEIVAKVRSVDDLDNAEARALRSILIKRANDAIQTEKGGHRHAETPQLIAGLTNLAGGGDTDAAQKLEELHAAVRVRETVSASRVSSERDLLTLITSLRQKEQAEGLSTAESSLLGGLEESLSDRRKAIAAGEHLDHANETGADLSLVGFAAKTRGEQIALLESLWGGQASFFTKTEVDSLKRQWDEGSVEMQAAVMAQVAEVPPEQRGAVLRQIAKSDQGMAVVAGLITDQQHPDSTGRRNLAEEAMQGRAFLKSQPGLLKDAKDVERDFTDRFSKVFATRGATNLVAAYTDAAMSIYAHRRRLAGDFKKAGDTDIKTIVDEIFGGGVWTVNGQQSAPLRPGLKASQSRDIWRSLIDEDLRGMSAQGPLPEGLTGLPVDNTVVGQQHEVGAARIVDEGWPMPAGDGSGRFVIVMPGNRITGEPFVLKDPRTGANFLFDPAAVGERPVLEVDLSDLPVVP